MSSRSVWKEREPLLLASTSRTRRHLLEAAGIPVEAIASGVDERALEAAAESTLSPAALAQRLATEKALAVSRLHPARLVLGADQVLDHRGIALHKPGRREAARDQLKRLAGSTHALCSAVALASGGAVVHAFVARADLTVRPLSGEAIDAYLDLAPPEVLNNAGVYQVEALGIHLLERIDGDHSTILGLPLLPCLDALRRLGCLAF